MECHGDPNRRPVIHQCFSMGSRPQRRSFHARSRGCIALERGAGEITRRIKEIPGGQSRRPHKRYERDSRYFAVVAEFERPPPTLLARIV